MLAGAVACKHDNGDDNIGEPDQGIHYLKSIEYTEDKGTWVSFEHKEFFRETFSNDTDEDKSFHDLEFRMPDDWYVNIPYDPEVLPAKFIAPDIAVDLPTLSNIRGGKADEFKITLFRDGYYTYEKKSVPEIWPIRIKTFTLPPHYTCDLVIEANLYTMDLEYEAVFHNSLAQEKTVKGRWQGTQPMMQTVTVEDKMKPAGENIIFRSEITGSNFGDVTEICIPRQSPAQWK